MNKMIFPIIFICLVSYSAFGQEVVGIGTFPEQNVGFYQEVESLQWDDGSPDVVTLTELKYTKQENLPIMVPPLGNYLNFQLKKLRVPHDAEGPLFEHKGKLSPEEELRYPERKFYLILPEKKPEK